MAILKFRSIWFIVFVAQIMTFLQVDFKNWKTQSLANALCFVLELAAGFDKVLQQCHTDFQAINLSNNNLIPPPPKSGVVGL